MELKVVKMSCTVDFTLFGTGRGIKRKSKREKRDRERKERAE